MSATEILWLIGVIAGGMIISYLGMCIFMAMLLGGVSASFISAIRGSKHGN